MKKRVAIVKRKTKETDIAIELNIDGTGKSKIKTGIGFLDHMLELFSFWGHFDLDVLVKRGDFNIDIHHTNEDIGIVLGDAFKQALGDKKGIRRFGDASVPMEDAIANVAVDISGRGFFKGIESNLGPMSAKKDEDYSLEYANHFFESLAKRMGMNLNIILKTTNPDLHTNLEPVFKALGKALDEATQIDPRRKGIPSTKGVID
ncbi:MAG: imidazoleglycerol-phosphate dehydratase [Candidatus Omnitrophica bacterium]|nr:imidazoleglycerol-phosphate dehydratase [Candidatus Omnitrophota bacterium]